MNDETRAVANTTGSIRRRFCQIGMLIIVASSSQGEENVDDEDKTEEPRDTGIHDSAIEERRHGDGLSRAHPFVSEVVVQGTAERRRPGADLGPKRYVMFVV